VGCLRAYRWDWGKRRYPVRCGARIHDRWPLWANGLTSGKRKGGIMSADDFEAAIEKCMAMINELPPDQRDPLLDLVTETRARHRRIQASVKHVMDALDDWRLIQKYKVFDQEARRRELGAECEPEDVDGTE